MNKRKATLYTIIISLITMIAIGLTLVTADGVRVEIKKVDDIDVALTVGDTGIETRYFEEDIMTALEERGVNPDFVNVQAFDALNISTSDEDASAIFNEWDNYPSDRGRWQLTTIDGESVIRSTVNTDWTGFWKEDDAGHVEVTSELAVTTNGDDDWVGITFRMNKYGPGHPENPYQGNIDAYDMYYFALDGGGVKDSGLFKLTKAPYENNMIGNSGQVMWGGPLNNAISVWNGVSFSQTGDAIPVQTNGHVSGRLGEMKPLQRATTSGLKWKRNEFQKVEVKAVGNHIEVWVDGDKEIDFVDEESPILTGGYGPYAQSQSHGTHRNFSVTIKETREFNELIRQPEWRDGSKRFVVNMENNEQEEFDNEHSLGEILTRLTNEQIDYVAVGSENNREQANRLINRNSGNGTYINGSDEYNKVIGDIADYIVNTLETGDNEQYVLIDQNTQIAVSPPEILENTETAEYPNGRWRIEHEYDYYENGSGLHELSGEYFSDFNVNFDKPGRYELFFEDNNTFPQHIYAHRKPIASYSMVIEDLNNQYGIEISDFSYDPDLESQSDRGIKEYEWKWKETTSETWTIGKMPERVPSGKDYIAQLRVKDHQDVWSDPIARYITTSEIINPPIADFDIPIQSLIYEDINIKDTSYDPAGRQLTGEEWVITRQGNEVYRGDSPVTNFTPYGGGRYIVSLRVQSSSGLWSEYFNRVIDITRDNIAPNITADKDSVAWTNEDVSINITFKDDGGSGFNGQRFVSTHSSNSPSSGWSSWSNNTSRSVNITSEGPNYIHAEARDGEGNLTKKTFGPYEIDKTPPTVSVTQDINDETHKDIKLSINATDNRSGIKRVMYEGESMIRNGGFEEGSKYWHAQGNWAGMSDLEYRDGLLIMHNVGDGLRSRVLQSDAFTGSTIGSTYYAEIVARGIGVINARYGISSGADFYDNYSQELTSETEFKTYKLLIEKGSGHFDSVILERIGDGYVEFDEIRIYAQNDLTDSRELIVTANGTYNFIVEDNAGNISTVSHEVTNIERILSMDSPTVENSAILEVSNDMLTKLSVGNLEIADWRENNNNSWSLYLEASKLSSDNHSLSSGSISIDGINSIQRIDGDGDTGSLNYLKENAIIDDGKVNLINALNQRGVYSVTFKDKALNIHPSVSEILKGTYNTKLIWTLESSPTLK